MKGTKSKSRSNASPQNAGAGLRHPAPNRRFGAGTPLVPARELTGPVGAGSPRAVFARPKRRCGLIIIFRSLWHLAGELLILPIRFYRRFISPFTPPTCRFTPTCSQYAIEAIRKHGPLKGLYLAVRRILRCHPWGGSGYDPVP